jgi:hypothetical protein
LIVVSGGVPAAAPDEPTERGQGEDRDDDDPAHTARVLQQFETPSATLPRGCSTRVELAPLSGGRQESTIRNDFPNASQEEKRWRFTSYVSR